MSGDRALLHLYRQLLRSCATYPSKNRWGIYQAIREEFRENRKLDPTNEKTKTMISVAYKGLSQLRQYDQEVLTGGNAQNSHWSVTLEQNPMPRRPDPDEEKS